jgi:hypothetical protein
MKRNYKKIGIPIMIIFSLGFASCLTWVFFHAEIDCPWNKYIDTEFSESLNKKNIEIVNKIQIGMSEKEIIELFGEPLFIQPLINNQKMYRYTNDGAAPFDWDFSWFEVAVIFIDDIVIEKRIGWVYD